MTKVATPRPVEEVLVRSFDGDIPTDVMPIVESAVLEAAKDTDRLGPRISVSVGRSWPEKYEGYSRVLVFDQYSAQPHNLQEAHIRSEDGRQVTIAIQGGSLIGWDPQTQSEPLPNRVRTATALALGANKEGCVEIKGLGPKTMLELDMGPTGPYFGLPIA